jgi:hypothetical protein
MIKALVCDQWLKTLFVAFMWGAQLNPLCVWPTIQLQNQSIHITWTSIHNYVNVVILYILHHVYTLSTCWQFDDLQDRKYFVLLFL